MEDIRNVGVEVLVVDRNGNGLFSPQSPRERDDLGVAMAC